MDSKEVLGKELILETKDSFESAYCDQNVFFKIGEGKNQYFTYTQLLFDPSSKVYRVFLTHDLYRTDKRSDFRLKADEYVSLDLEIKGKNFEVIDISAGGISFYINLGEQKGFEKGRVLKNITLSLNEIKFDIPWSKIVGFWIGRDSEELPTGKIKIGLAFQALPIETEKELFQEINKAMENKYST